jgi:putative ABC transport system ATP-binding protein
MMNAEPAIQSGLAIDMHGVSVGSMRDANAISVENVDWQVAPGDFWAIGGVHGSGRSDLLMMAGGLMGPTGGTYKFFDNPMPIFEGERLQQRLRLGFVFNEGNLLNQLTVAQNVALPWRYHHDLGGEDSDARVQQLLQITGLEELAGSTPGAITRNWHKRAGLARALILKPEVLLVENPLAGLDLRHRSWWFNFLGDLSRGHAWMDGKAMTLVISTDDFRPWQNIARQFAVLKEKHFLALGDWAHLEAVNDEMVRELHAPAHTLQP